MPEWTDADRDHRTYRERKINVGTSCRPRLHILTAGRCSLRAAVQRRGDGRRRARVDRAGAVVATRGGPAWHSLPRRRRRGAGAPPQSGSPRAGHQRARKAHLDAVERVEAGTWDGAILDDSLLAPGSVVSRRASESPDLRTEELVTQDPAYARKDRPLHALLGTRIGCDTVRGALDLSTLCMRN